MKDGLFLDLCVCVCVGTYSIIDLINRLTDLIQH